MVPEQHSGKTSKANPRHQRSKGDCLITAPGAVYAQRPHSTAGHLRAGVISRSGEWIELDSQGVVLVRMGKRHVLHLWGHEPSVYLPH
jgi:hypothetical protein